MIATSTNQENIVKVIMAVTNRIRIATAVRISSLENSFIYVLSSKRVNKSMEFYSILRFFFFADPSLSIRSGFEGSDSRSRNEPQHQVDTTATATESNIPIDIIVLRDRSLSVRGKVYASCDRSADRSVYNRPLSPETVIRAIHGKSHPGRLRKGYRVPCSTSSFLLRRSVGI